jgi:hypothetical protein
VICSARLLEAVVGAGCGSPLAVKGRAPVGAEVAEDLLETSLLPSPRPSSPRSQPMNGYLVVLAMMFDEVPISLHWDFREAEAAACKVAEDPEGALRGLEIDWLGTSEIELVRIVEFANGRPVQLMTIWDSLVDGGR